MMLSLYFSSILIYLIIFVAYGIIVYFVGDKEKLQERCRKIEEICGSSDKKGNWLYVLAISAVPVLRLFIAVLVFAVTFMSDEAFEKLLIELEEE